MNRLLVGMIGFVIAGPAWAQVPVIVPFETIPTRHMIIDVKVNGKGPYTLIFDTGAPATLVSAKLAKEARISGPTSLLAMFTGNSGQRTIESLKLGDLSLDKVETMVLDHPTVNTIARITNKKIDGIIGFNVFARYKMTIDYQAKTLAFAPSDFRPVPIMDHLMKLMMPSADDLKRVSVSSPGGLFGVSVAKKSDDDAAGVTVERVMAGSPADRAGLKAGDRILAIDHRWTDREIDCFDALRGVQPGDVVRVEITRNGKSMSLDATVALGF